MRVQSVLFSKLVSFLIPPEWLKFRIVIKVHFGQLVDPTI